LFVILPFSVVAVIFGHIALFEIRKSPGRLKGRGLAITGMVLGYLGVLFIIAFIGLGIYEVRKTAKQIDTPGSARGEGSVVASMRSLNMAEIAYGQVHHDVGYTCSLSELSGVWGLSKDLAGGKKNGYRFELKNCASLKPGGPIARYQLLAYSESPASPGAVAYCTDESDIIRVVRKGSPQDCFATGTRWDDPGTKKTRH
jgi:hypothetical protein